MALNIDVRGERAGTIPSGRWAVLCVAAGRNGRGQHGLAGLAIQLLAPAFHHAGDGGVGRRVAWGLWPRPNPIRRRVAFGDGLLPSFHQPPDRLVRVGRCLGGAVLSTKVQGDEEQPSRAQRFRHQRSYVRFHICVHFSALHIKAGLRPAFFAGYVSRARWRRLPAEERDRGRDGQSLPFAGARAPRQPERRHPMVQRGLLRSVEPPARADRACVPGAVQGGGRGGREVGVGKR